MKLQVVLPTRIFLQRDNLSHMSIDTPAGNLGFLPQRLDCVVPVSPGILTCRRADTDTEEFIAIDTGILIKTGAQIVVSVHHAVASANLAELEQIIHAEFEQLSEQEKLVRSISAGIETKLVRRFIELRRDY
ncbi:MAG: F0F1 ATP synthase subunit epsilon [Desulfuromonadaceae bacterium]|nr:F0F1 ATP synthase subunit epsilon [Desulfuromonadaceae bacterium]